MIYKDIYLISIIFTSQISLVNSIIVSASTLLHNHNIEIFYISYTAHKQYLVVKIQKHNIHDSLKYMFP